MIPWELIDSARVPGSDVELLLSRRDDEMSISIAGHGQLMSSRSHASEDALAELTCDRLKDTENAGILIGGLGMGFTLAAALRRLGKGASVLVAELVPQVVVWNRGEAGKYSGHPLQDKRVTVKETDVAAILRDSRQSFHAILLDVDNGPEGLTRPENDWLYSLKGLTAAAASLRKGGVLAIWSSSPDSAFLQRLYKVGFKVEEVQVRSHGRKGTKHIIWFAIA